MPTAAASNQRLGLGLSPYLASASFLLEDLVLDDELVMCDLDYEDRDAQQQMAAEVRQRGSVKWWCPNNCERVPLKMNILGSISVFFCIFLAFLGFAIEILSARFSGSDIL